MERLLRRAHLPADVPHGRTTLRLPERKLDLRFIESALLHCPGPQAEAGLSQKLLTL